AGQAGCRSSRAYRVDRGGRRQRAFGHVLLPILCARDRRGERLEAPCNEQREDDEHPRRLRLQPDTPVDGRVRRSRSPRSPVMSAHRRCLAGHAMCEAVLGVALAARGGFSARYELDRQAGGFSRPQHALWGQSYVERILVLDTSKGGVASAWMLAEMRSRGVSPLAIVFNSVNPILVQGAAFAELTMLAGFDVDITVE